MGVSYKIVAFSKEWAFKGYIDPSHRDDVVYIRFSDAKSFIDRNKPKDEHWLIEVLHDD